MTLAQIKSTIKTVQKGNYGMLCDLELRGNKLYLVNKYTGSLHIFPNDMEYITIPIAMIKNVKELIPVLMLFYV